MRAHPRAVMLLAATATCALPAAASASVSPRRLLASSLGAARAQRSVHYVSSASAGVMRLGQVGDAGLTQGIQRITYRKRARTGHVTVIVSAKTAYLRGDAFTLESYLRFKTASAAKYAGRWIVVPHTDRDYAPVAAGVTLSSTIAELQMSPPFSRVPDTTIDGRRVHGVRGRSPAPGHAQVLVLYVRAAGLPLPVQETFSQGSLRGRVTLGRWNELVHLATPRAAMPISKTR